MTVTSGNTDKRQQFLAIGRERNILANILVACILAETDRVLWQRDLIEWARLTREYDALAADLGL